jgi:hypothetical protein
MDWGDPVIVSAKFMVNGVVVATCVHCTYTNSPYILSLGGELHCPFQTTRKKWRIFTMDWGEPVLLSGKFMVNGVVVATCVHCTHTNRLYILSLGAELRCSFQTTRKKWRIFTMDWGDPVLLSAKFTVNAIVVAPCMHCMHMNSLYIFPLGS